MKEGDVVIVAMPQFDGTIKNRPAVVLREMRPFRDMLVCGVSTQLSQAVNGFDEIISPRDADFSSAGLKAESVIRLGYLVLVPRRKIHGTIGSVGGSRHKRLLKTLADYLVA